MSEKVAECCLIGVTLDPSSASERPCLPRHRGGEYINPPTKAALCEWSCTYSHCPNRLLKFNATWPTELQLLLMENWGGSTLDIATGKSK